MGKTEKNWKERKNNHTNHSITQSQKHELARFRELGILIGKGGLYGNILRIKPPMCINSADVDFVLECMDNALSTYKDVSL